MNLYNCVSLLTATVEATSEHVYPDGSVQTSDLSVARTGFSGFEWFGQFMNWISTQRLPLPGGYNITFLDVVIAVIFLYIIGWMFGKLISGRRGE